MKNLVGQSDSITAFDTSAKAAKRTKRQNKESDSPKATDTTTKNENELDLITGIGVEEGRMRNPYSTDTENDDSDPFGRLVSDRIANGRYTPGPEAKGEDSYILYQDINGNKVFDAEDKRFGTLIASDAALAYWQKDLPTPITSPGEGRRFEIKVTNTGAYGIAYSDGFPQYEITITDISVFL
jgi:hypothetical protein